MLQLKVPNFERNARAPWVESPEKAGKCNLSRLLTRIGFRKRVAQANPGRAMVNYGLLT